MIAKAQSLDNFIDKSLYEKNKGYYQIKVEFGRRGDFITSPGISKLFSEMIAIWVVSFWENLNKPEKINLVELGAGNGELIEVLINTLNKLEIVKVLPSISSGLNFFDFALTPLLLNLYFFKVSGSRPL